jgi:mycoredoxin
MEPDATTRADPPGDHAVVFYWRPGCIFCVLLRRSLDRRGIPLEARNIWQEPAAAAEVRSVAGGNETVPTVAVGGRFLVNPSPRAVERLVAEVAPHLLG